MPKVPDVVKKVNIADLGFTYNEITIKYGSFLSAVIDFLIIAFSIFVGITIATKINKKINEIFGSLNHVYKSRVRITMNDGIHEEEIVGKTNINLLTIDNKLIKITDILDIEKI